MRKTQRIWIVRHAQSAANVDFDLYAQMPDSVVSLTPEGEEQADKVGDFLVDAIFEARHPQYSDFPRELRGVVDGLTRVKVWSSPYARARTTMGSICAKLTAAGGYQVSYAESTGLREQGFGVWTGLRTEERLRDWPRESALYDKFKAAGERFWAPIPCGESLAQVSDRVRSVINEIRVDADRCGVDDIVVVSHGLVSQCMVMQWMDFPYKWVTDNSLLENCEVRLIEDDQSGRPQYKGSVFPGFTHAPVPPL